VIRRISNDNSHTNKEQSHASRKLSSTNVTVMSQRHTSSVSLSYVQHSVSYAPTSLQFEHVYNPGFPKF